MKKAYSEQPCFCPEEDYPHPGQIGLSGRISGKSP